MPRTPDSNSTISPAWDAVEPVGAGDTVTDGEHLAHLGYLGFLAEILDLLFQDRGDLGSADVHRLASLNRNEVAVEKRERACAEAPTSGFPHREVEYR